MELRSRPVDTYNKEINISITQLLSTRRLGVLRLWEEFVRNVSSIRARRAILRTCGFHAISIGYVLDSHHVDAWRRGARYR
jgi:hypothetical protein